MGDSFVNKGGEQVVDLIDAETWYHAMGTSATPAAGVTDTALTAEVETRVAGTDSQTPTAQDFYTEALILATAARAIQEWGLFNAIVAGLLFARSTFTTMNLGIGDGIRFKATFNVPGATT